MFNNSFWESGFVGGLLNKSIISNHSVAFIDGYEFGLAVRRFLDNEIDTESFPQPANMRSSQVRGILEENRRLKEEVALLRGKNKAE